MTSEAPDDWDAVTVRELAADGGLIGGPFGSSLGTKDYVPQGVPVIRGSNLARAPFVAADLVFVSDAKARSLRRCVALPGDIVVTQRGTLGQVGRIPRGLHDRWVVSQSQMALRVDPSRAIAHFVFLCLRAPQVQQQIRDNAIVTGVPHINLGIFGRLELFLPRLPEQERIAFVLGALDDKIDSNRRLAALLERTAATLVERSQSTASMSLSVGDVATFHNKYRVPLSADQRRVRPGPFPYYGATGVIDHIDDFLFSGTYALVGEDGSVETATGHPVMQYVWGDFWVNNHAHVLTFGDVPLEVGYLVMRGANVAPFLTGAVQPKLSMRRLKEVELRWPRAIADLARPVCTLFGGLRAVMAEMVTLTAIRDALLPKLISGVIRVPYAVDPAEVIEPAREALPVTPR